MNHVYSAFRFRASKVIILIGISIIGVVVISNTNSNFSGFRKQNIQASYVAINSYKENHDKKINEYFNQRKNWNTSNLGAILFKNIDAHTFSGRKNKTFNILIWKHLKAIKSRHFFYFGSNERDPLEDCSVKNCVFTGDDNLLPRADVVVIHLQRGVMPSEKYPGQLWVFLNDESPWNAFSLAKSPLPLRNLAYKFNCSMNYRSDSDVPVPYGRTIALPRSLYDDISYLEMVQLIPFWENKRRDVLITVLMSNCHVPARMKFLNEIKKYTRVDVYGKCADDPRNKNKCPGHIRSDCEFMSNYLFYLVLENSMCKEYITEKLFYHAYTKGAIPIIFGPPLEDCKALLPPNSFIHVNSFANTEDMAKEIISISVNEDKLLAYHLWRNDFDVVNEHGYFGSKSYHMCRLCEALNYNDLKDTLYDEDRIRNFLDPKRTCK